MSNTTSLQQIKRAYKLFAHKNVEKATLRYNVRSYLKAMAVLGNKHILATPVQRKN